MGKQAYSIEKIREMGYELCKDKKGHTFFKIGEQHKENQEVIEEKEGVTQMDFVFDTVKGIADMMLHLIRATVLVLAYIIILLFMLWLMYHAVHFMTNHM
jgi:hypothetical protein